MNLPQAIEKNISAALREDLGSGDLTARLIPCGDAPAPPSTVAKHTIQ
jgi:nicotinate-nucleotide pyrophosphorylase